MKLLLKCKIQQANVHPSSSPAKCHYDHRKQDVRTQAHNHWICKSRTSTKLPETRQEMESNAYSASYITLFASVEETVFHHTFGILSTNINPTSKHNKRQKNGGKNGELCQALLYHV
jgi:hypothetical protein